MPEDLATVGALSRIDVLMETAFDWIAQHGYGAIFVLLMLGIVGLPVPDETLLMFVGYLSFKGELRLGPAVATAFLGSACGVSISYALGRLVGLSVVTKLGPLFHLRPEHLEETHRWIERWGKYTLFIAYFIPGVRHLAALVLGASALSPMVFVRFAYAGALVWSSSFIALGYFGGEEWRQLSPLLDRTLVIVVILVFLTLAIALLAIWRRAQRN